MHQIYIGYVNHSGKQLLQMAASFSIYAFLCLVPGFLCGVACERNCTNVAELWDHGNNSIVLSLSLRNFEKATSMQSCYHGYWKMNITFTDDHSGNPSCSNVTVCFDTQCVSHLELALSKAKKELLNMEVLSITTTNLSSSVRVCHHQQCDFILGSESQSKASRVKVQFEQNGVSLSSTVSAVGVLFQHEVGKVKNVPINRGDRILFGDRAPVVIAVQQGQNLSTQEVTIEFDQPHPLDYIDKTIRVTNISAICAFYDTEYGGWDSSVCKNPPDIAKTTIKCTCEHNSAFAVMFAVGEIKFDETLQVVSIVFEIASIVALLATCTLLILYRRKLRNFDRVLVQISLCISLTMAHTILLLSSVAISNNTFCQAVIILSHYFLITTAILMVMEGGIMLTKVLYPNFGASSHSVRRRGIGFTIAWIVPMAYAGVCAGAGIANGKYIDIVGRFEVCWITDSFNLVVIVPMAIAIGINILIAIRLGVLVASLSKKAEDFKPSNEREASPLTHATKAFRAVLILLPILGIPWAIGFLVNTGHPTNVVFASIHVVVNGCQGMFMFLHYVLFNSDMKACVRRAWESAKSEMPSLSPIVHFSNNNRTDSTTAIKID